LTAGLFAGAIAALGPRPWLAGLCFGLAVYKPQLGLLVPIALAAGGHWRSVLAATVTVAILAAACTMLFGAQVWADFFAGAGTARQVILDDNGVGYDKLVSVFAWLRLWRSPLRAAYAGQAIAAILVAAMTFRLWRSNDLRLQGAGLCLGALLVTPFALDYDLMLLAPAILLLAGDAMEHPKTPVAANFLFCLCVMPLFARGVAHSMALPLACWALAIGFGYSFSLAAKRV
jgi:hypothetical protein